MTPAGALDPAWKNEIAMFSSADCAKLGFALLMMLVAGTAGAQSYPNHLVRIIVPFAAGGLNDTAARLIQPYLQKALGQAVIVENRPAARGGVGADGGAKGT